MSLLVALLATGCIDATTDPVALGELCAPATTSCPAVASLERDAVGRNQIDYTIDLADDAREPTAIEVLALVPSAAYDPTDPTVTIPEADVVARQAHLLEPGGTVRSRLTAQRLGVRRELDLALRCDGCDARLLYVFANAPLECTEDGDCSGGWICDTVYGRCVECLSEEECAPAQVCDEELGRCDPPASSSCATGGPSSPRGAAGALLLAALLLGVAALQRRRRATVILALLLLASATMVAPASAAPPRGALSVGGGPRFLTGPIGRDTERGVGLSIGQELRWVYVGLGIELSTSFYLTTQSPPPFSNTLQTYAFTIGPRGYVPLGGDVELTFGPDYRRLGLAANSLVRQTGTETSFHAWGASGGLRYRWSAFELRLGGGYHPIVGLDGAILTVDAAVAITTAP